MKTQKQQRFLTQEQELKIGIWRDSNDICSYKVIISHRKVEGISHIGVKKELYF